ncbi:3,4-dihydroxy-2-butanone-4-phosphate synthase [Enterococcus sp. DIV0660C]|uniref:3,4-dihydroxy-2-butanone-4-phosphate synthase n=1 Tax=Enterococcus sp. DIV0660C TaxID=2230880 RepID=UPI001A90BA52|nr:3,4-dihydroxy-2-butanone-4-phosphate synthase [Enterococcus sp. DIV0660C]MBO0432900.1 3,4-dihydroxy-2-butanone-4-phosphate synthase [Enterococcus sp. DIV0660C]
MNKKYHDSIETALEVLSDGGVIIISDNEDRENEGDILGLAETITEDGLNFMITEGKGLVCTPISEELAKTLALQPMVKNNTEMNGTAFTNSIDGSYDITGVTTGISVGDRLATIKRMIDNDVKSTDFVQPGHTFPLVAKEEGVLEREGHTEAAVDLAKLCGMKPAGVICEIIKPDGSMARTDYLFDMAEKFNIPFITIKDLVNYKKNNVASLELSHA